VGVGVGWLAGEFSAVGVDFASRGRRTDEALVVCRRLWSEPTVEHHGEFFSFGPVAFEPKPVQRPWPRLHIGGESPAALRRAVTFGDGWLSIAVLTQIMGTYDQVGELQERVAVYAEELTARTLADARDIVTESSGVLLDGGPFGADELRRWREALLGVAEGLGVMEAEVKRQASAAIAPAFKAWDAAAESKEFDLRKIDLGLDPGPPSGRKRARERDAGGEFER
jgi:alkanesulfonate monooxygenase SsuD/methylene tetrahydromethanopterin reductase-like flavin-dependent oxidoreductase (luciferase family)